MSNSLFTAATGMEAQQLRISVISNNLANMNTAGFKASRAEFQDLIYQNMQTAGTENASGVQTPGGFQVGTGVKVVSTPTLHTQGNLEQTGRNLDVSINGPGFFSVTMPSGEIGYSRAGSLSVNATGQIVNQDGYPLNPSVAVTTTNLDRTVGVDGTVSARDPATGTIVVEGQISTFTFANEAGLTQVGKTLFMESTASGTGTQGTPGSAGFGEINAGFLEGSNVNIAEELIRMIMAQRAFELNSKVIQTSDQMLASTNQIR